MLFHSQIVLTIYIQVSQLPLNLHLMIIKHSSGQKVQLDCLQFASAWIHPRRFVGSVLFILLIFYVVFCLSLFCVPNVSSNYGLSISYCPFGFLSRLLVLQVIIYRSLVHPQLYIFYTPVFDIYESHVIVEHLKQVGRYVLQ